MISAIQPAHELRETGSAPSRLSTTRTTAICARARPRPRPVLDIPPMPEINQQPGQPIPRRSLKAANDPAAHHQSVTRIKPHVRRTGLAGTHPAVETSSQTMFARAEFSQYDLLADTVAARLLELGV